jgi:hypothetical protein
MLTLCSCPELFGVIDNNGYGLKVFAFLKLAGVPFCTSTFSTRRRRRTQIADPNSLTHPQTAPGSLV